MNGIITSKYLTNLHTRPHLLLGFMIYSILYIFFELPVYAFIILTSTINYFVITTRPLICIYIRVVITNAIEFLR